MSHKNVPISYNESQFKNTWQECLEELKFFPVRMNMVLTISHFVWQFL